MSKYGLGLARMAKLGRRQLIAFAVLSAIVNGCVTALVGAWMTQSYASYHRKATAIQSLSDLAYERRSRAGMVRSAILRGGELDELRYRKRAYDEAFVGWNKRLQDNIFMIREVTGEPGVTRLETQFQELMVPAFSDIDSCLTKAYDARIAGGDGKPLLESCRMSDLYQLALDCTATFTNELSKLSHLSFLPFSQPSSATLRTAEARIDRGCRRPPAPLTTDTPVVVLPPPQTGAGLPTPSSTANPAPNSPTLATTPAH